jgi:hypothetical protein
MRAARKSLGGTGRIRGKVFVGVKPMTWGERLGIVDALTQVLDGIYSHLPLKRSLYGFDVVRGLATLRHQVPTMSDLQFHRELTLLINRLRDAHTQYTGPWTVPAPVASLPFLVEAFGPAERPTYVVSKTDRRSIRDRNFVEGVTIDYWNGVPFDRAVDLQTRGGVALRRVTITAAPGRLRTISRACCSRRLRSKGSSFGTSTRAGCSRARRKGTGRT